MTYMDFSHVELSAEFISHVLFGEKGNPHRGGHLSGQKRENKTEFPPDWNEEQIVLALKSVLNKPEIVVEAGPRVILRRQVSGVSVQIILLKKGSTLIPHAAYPLGGPGVVQNVLGRQLHISLSSLRNGL